MAAPIGATAGSRCAYRSTAGGLEADGQPFTVECIGIDGRTCNRPTEPHHRHLTVKGSRRDPWPAAIMAASGSVRGYLLAHYAPSVHHVEHFS